MHRSGQGASDDADGLIAAVELDPRVANTGSGFGRPPRRRSRRFGWFIVLDRVHDAHGAGLTENARIVLGGTGFAASALLLEFSVIVAGSVFTGSLCHNWAYRDAGDPAAYVGIGGAIALLYALPFVVRGEYAMRAFQDGRRSLGRMALVWTCAFLTLGVIGFLTKTTSLYSPGALLLFYLVGFCGLVAMRDLILDGLEALARANRLARRRLMLVGGAGEIQRFSAEIGGRDADFRVVGRLALPARTDRSDAAGDALVSSALTCAVDQARLLDADDIVILTDWSRTDLIQEIVEAFRAVPAAIHLGASSVVGPFSNARISHFAGTTAVTLTTPPLNPMQALVKRLFDIVVSGTALVLLAPLFAVIAILIKATSKGPVFFRQRRRGYNQVEFRIWKFRTMTTMNDGLAIEQAQKNDLRVTGIGRFLRRTSLDELPQLINVLAGEMSLVGPRPHAVAHDELFEQRISTYTRRLNVRPGITGWAQVQGFRGRTETDEAMRQRVDCDLYYIDNWSIVLDLYIIFLTVFSPKAKANAH